MKSKKSKLARKHVKIPPAELAAYDLLVETGFVKPCKNEPPPKRKSKPRPLTADDRLLI